MQPNQEIYGDTNMQTLIKRALLVIKTFGDSLAASFGETGLSIDLHGIIYVSNFTNKAVYALHSDGMVTTYFLLEQPWSGTIGTINISDSETSFQTDSENSKLSATEVALIVVAAIVSTTAVISTAAAVIWISKSRMRKNVPVELPTVPSVVISRKEEAPTVEERKRTLSNVRRASRLSVNIQGKSGT